MAREIASALRSINRSVPQFEFLGYIVSDLSRLRPRDSRDQLLGDFGWLRANRAFHRCTCARDRHAYYPDETCR